MPAQVGWRADSGKLRPQQNLPQRFKYAATTPSSAIHNSSGGNTRSHSGHLHSRSRHHTESQQTSHGAAADIPGGGELYLTAGERSVTRGKRHLHVSSPEGANSIRKRDGERKAPSIVHCPLSVVHCSRRSPPSGTHTQVGFPIRRLRSLRSLTRG